jgi:hypothetical protein
MSRISINKGDRVAHVHGFFGTALSAEDEGVIQVRHDSGAVSTWAAGDTAVVTRAAAGPAPLRARRARKKKPPSKRVVRTKVSKKRVPPKRLAARRKAKRGPPGVKKRPAKPRKKSAAKRNARKPL